MLNSSGESGLPCFIPDFRGNGFSFSPLSMMLALHLSYTCFIMLRYILSISSYLRPFIMKWFWILSEAFSASIEMIKWFLSLVLLMYCFAFIDLHMLNHPCMARMKPTWLC
jgi:L-cystine uptake protein TcyP (sodium:dicarboxylate symporter family)